MAAPEELWRGRAPVVRFLSLLPLHFSAPFYRDALKEILRDYLGFFLKWWTLPPFGLPYTKVLGIEKTPSLVILNCYKYKLCNN